MGVSLKIKSLLASIFHSSGFVKNHINKYKSSGYPILMYHRILPSEEAEKGTQAGMYVEPETFEMHIRYLRNNFNIVSLEHVFQIKKGFKEMDEKAPYCVITFDDGWYDFYEFGYPILEKYDAPATVFLPTNYIGAGSDSRFWTDRVADLFVKAKNRLGPMINTRHYHSPIAEKLARLRGPTDKRIEQAISLLKKRKGEEINLIIKELESAWGIAPIPEKRAFLTWEEARNMAAPGLVTFGSHTANHKILVYLEDHEIREELMQSKRKLLEEGVVSPQFIPFCYPNGDYDERIGKIVAETGYHLAVTTENDWNHPNTPAFNLRRIAIHQDMTSTSEMFGCRIAKIF